MEMPTVIRCCRKTSQQMWYQQIYAVTNVSCRTTTQHTNLLSLRCFRKTVILINNKITMKTTKIGIIFENKMKIDPM